MNNINSFTFYKNYYELLDNIPKKDKLILLEAIVDYMFNDKEPELDGLNKAIWNNIVMPLNTSKNNSKRSLNHNQKETETLTEVLTKKKPKRNRSTNQKETNNISISNFLFPFSNNIKELLKEYLDIRNKKKYVVNEIVLKRIENKLKDKPEYIQKQMLENAINGGWKDLYEVEQQKEPEWFDKKIEKQEITKEEQEELEKILGKYEKKDNG